MLPVDRGTFLRSHYLFRDLGAQVVGKIDALVTTRRLDKGEHLFQKGIISLTKQGLKTRRA